MYCKTELQNSIRVQFFSFWDLFVWFWDKIIEVSKACARVEGQLLWKCSQLQAFIFKGVASKSKTLQNQKIELANRALSSSSFLFLLMLITTGSWSLSAACFTTIFQKLSTILSSPSLPCFHYPGKAHTACFCSLELNETLSVWVHDSNSAVHAPAAVEPSKEPKCAHTLNPRVS